MKKVAILYNDDADHLQRGTDLDRVIWGGGGRIARSVAEALHRGGYSCEEVTCGGSLERLLDDLERARPDVVFNQCESFAGDSRREGTVASLLELLHIPFTGNDPLTLGLAHDKARSKELLRTCGLPVAGCTPPLIVKPRYEDASHGISASSVCATYEEALDRAAEVSSRWRQDCVIEEFLPGREFNAGVVLDGIALPPSEIEYRLPEHLPRLVTFEAKWVEDSEYYRGTPACCPAALSPELAEEIRRLTLGAWRAFGCRDYARVDLRLGADGRPRILEVNPNPDISPDAGLAKAAAKGGLEYDCLISRIVEQALARGSGRSAGSRAS